MKRLLRALLGALWSIPLRLFSIPAIVGGMVYAAGGSLQTQDLLTAKVVLTGVTISAALRFIDNLLVEFAVFPAAMKIMEGRK